MDEEQIMIGLRGWVPTVGSPHDIRAIQKAIQMQEFSAGKVMLQDHHPGTCHMWTRICFG